MRYEVKELCYQFGKPIYGIFDNKSGDFVRDKYGIAISFSNKDFAELIAKNIHTNGRIEIKIDGDKMRLIDVVDLMAMVYGYFDGDKFSIVAEG